MLIYFWLCLAFVALCGLSLVVVSTSYQGVSTSVLSLSIRLQREGKLPSLWLTKLITWTTGLSNSMKLWAIPGRATQDGQVTAESSDQTWSAKGNGKPLQYSCLENPMNSMKRQKDKTLKDELPRSVGAQYAIGEEWTNTSRKKEETEPKQKQHPGCDWWWK